MSRATFICALLSIFAGWMFPADQRSLLAPTDHFEIARHTFIDVGPPNDFYELFVVRATADGTLVERFRLTPPGNACLAPAKLETASATIHEPVSELLSPVNPCAIPEKELHRELERRKKRLVFSGANVLIRVPCGEGTRLIRADILDRDMFDAAPDTPKNTSWTMRLLGRLDEAIGGLGVLDRPIFPLPSEEEPPNKELDPPVLARIGAGEYDSLFPDAPDKPSILYHAAQTHPPPPTIRLVSVSPISPDAAPLPKYPPLAQMAEIEGSVSVKMGVDEKGNVTSITFDSGHPLLRRAVEDALRKWNFPAASANRQVQATIEFVLNCHRAKN